MTILTLNNNQTETSEYVHSSNQHEFQEMTNESLNSNVPLHDKNRNMLTDDQTLLNLDSSTNIKQERIINTTVLLTDIPNSLNTVTKQFSLLYENTTSSSTTESDEEENETVSNIYNIEHRLTSDHSQQKRHIMISYNRSSIQTCRKIYHHLVERNYKVWMDLEHMFDDIFVGMARAIENSYIILLCINQQYYESAYCRKILEAEYAVENQIQFISCLMEVDFKPRSWLRRIQRSNVHIDFSLTNNFEKSFEELIHRITYIENKLALQQRQTSATGLMMFASMPTSIVTSRCCDPIICENTRTRHLQSELIAKLSQELFNETSQSLLDDEELLQQFVSRIFHQNELLLTLVNRLTTQKYIRRNRKYNFDVDRIIKVALTIMLLWALTIVYQKTIK